MVLCFGFAVSVRVQGQTNPVPPAVETLICIRHGEKSATGLGQLSCQGLNRALALPRVLLSKYGTPQFVFAPDPTQTITEYAGAYIMFVHWRRLSPRPFIVASPSTRSSASHKSPSLRGASEGCLPKRHHLYRLGACSSRNFWQDMVELYGGDPTQVPVWPENDYDTMFVIQITRNQGQKSVAFTMDHEGLNDLRY